MKSQKVIGVAPVSYDNKDGRHVSGVRVYVASSFPSPADGVGVSVSEYFISGSSDVSAYPLGDIVTVTFETRFGRAIATGVVYK